LLPNSPARAFPCSKISENGANHSNQLFFCRLFHETAMPAHNNITVYYGEIEWLKSIIACFAFVI